MTGRLHILKLRLRAFGQDGSVYSRTIEFGNGLTIILGTNSSGKSLCIMSILYALGAEGMLSAKRAVPLPHALTDFLKDGTSDVHLQSSDVTLELANHVGEEMTVKRVIRRGPGAPEDTHLVHTWKGRVLSESMDLAEAATDYYVRMPGSAKHESGFHTLLATFLGWSLPTVTKFDGTETLLYIECIFPLFFIEQKKGWSGLQARMPTYLGIRDIHTRAIEFLLKLDVYSVRSRIRTLELEIEDCQAAWRGLLSGLEGIARSIGGMVNLTLPGEPEILQTQPDILVPSGENWRGIGEVMETFLSIIASIDSETVPSIRELASALEEDQEKTESEVTHLDALVVSATEELEFELAQKVGALSRLTNLKIDLQKNKDVQRLRELGSASAMKTTANQCPTCLQPISGASGLEGPVMTLDDNIEFVHDMMQAVSGSLRETEMLIASKQLRLEAMRARRTEAKRRLRSIKESLVQDARLPATVEIERKARLEQHLFAMKQVHAAFMEKLKEIARLGTETTVLRDELRVLKATELSSRDQEKLKCLGRSFSDQIRAYGLESIRGTRIFISPQNYRPMAADLPDLEFELSGSDLIRAVWAYYLALLEVSRNGEFEYNHPGILIMDEPRQQGVELDAVLAMLRRAASSRKHGQQVIVSLNKKDQRAVEDALAGETYKIVTLNGLALERQ